MQRSAAVESTSTLLHLGHEECDVRDGGWSLMDSMAQLSSLWRDVGLNLVLRCLTGSVLMWLSNHAYCCFTALQRAASFSPMQGFQPEVSISGCGGNRFKGKTIYKDTKGELDWLSCIWVFLKTSFLWGMVQFLIICMCVSWYIWQHLACVEWGQIMQESHGLLTPPFPLLLDSHMSVCSNQPQNEMNAWILSTCSNNAAWFISFKV